jgi:hypothetical protein
MTRRSQQYPRELRERAVRMVAEVTPNYDLQWATRLAALDRPTLLRTSILSCDTSASADDRVPLSEGHHVRDGAVRRRRPRPFGS